MVRRVHVVFKTHLDIGFTDSAARTVKRYYDQFIPKAVEVAARLRHRGTSERLVLTTGSWLIKRYLDQADEAGRSALEEAIEHGDIRWHGLPFTTHTELMDSHLVRYALSLSKDLDHRFSRETIAAKMTDVPGHTLALVPYLAEAGIRFLHLGVNGGSPLPDVPRLFRWRAPTGEEVVVQYDASYGSSEPIGELEDLLVIENSADNMGPPSEAEVVETFRRLRREWPDAEILASDLSAYARAILPSAEELPLVEAEIGDTWIHGVGSDPYKVSRFRRILAWIDANPSSLSNDRFMDQLLLVCEHTWGLDFKKYLADYTNWSVDDFHRARERDLVGPDAIPDEYQFIEEFAQREHERMFPLSDTRRERRTYSAFTAAHEEQRLYVTEAIAALEEGQRESLLQALTLPAPMGNGTPIEAGDEVSIGSHRLLFGDDGSLESYRGEDGRQLAGGEGIGVYRYQSFSAKAYEAYHRQYNRNFESERAWVLPDFGKPGMENAIPPAEDRLWGVNLTSLKRFDGDGPVEVRADLQCEEGSPRGAPRYLSLSYRFTTEGVLQAIRLTWREKEATRLPEALWLSVALSLREDGEWRMIKMGRRLAMDNTVSRGARSVHAVEGVEYSMGEDRLLITNRDSPLVSIGRRALLRFDDEPATVNGTFHFNLCNNLWNTNFPLWYEEDGSSVLEFEGRLPNSRCSNWQRGLSDNAATVILPPYSLGDTIDRGLASG
ncbi:MAG TPA: DUF5054 domain-containing protein [Sphaerochaeta sp.]|nr:DUF5054 domain-containing protein [Sphaerochaeta sp.]